MSDTDSGINVSPTSIKIDWKVIGGVIAALGLGGGQITSMWTNAETDDKVAEVKSNLTDTARDLKSACEGLVGPPMPTLECVTAEELKKILKQTCE
jgi:hypothetical protein